MSTELVLGFCQIYALMSSFSEGKCLLVILKENRLRPSHRPLENTTCHLFHCGKGFPLLSQNIQVNSKLRQCFIFKTQAECVVFISFAVSI